MKKRYLVLENGKVFEGKAFGADAGVTGELVFNTGAVGYIELLTDPGYLGQIVVQTFPAIGNYGIIPEDFESNYCDWSPEITTRRIAKLKKFGDPESVCEAILGMPTPELEDALYNKAVVKGVKFTQGQLNRMGHVELQLKKVLDNFATDEQISQLEQDVDVLCKQLDENSRRSKPAKGCLQTMIEYSLFCFIVMVVLIICIMLLIASGN